MSKKQPAVRRVRPSWKVLYYWNARWNSDSIFFSKRAAADYAGRVFGQDCHWKIRRVVRIGGKGAGKP